MAPIQRIRRRNARESFPVQDFDRDFCQAVVAGSTIYLRGQVGADLATGETVGVGDAGAQAEQAMRNVEQLLGECRASLADIVKVVVYLVRREDRAAVYRALGRALKGVQPVSTGPIVAGLAEEDWLVEIEVTAVRQYEAGRP